MQLINRQANDSKNVTIELQNLKFAYSQEQSLVITKLNHIFDAGLLHVVRGDSGRGKSTLLSLIMGAEEAQDGQVLFNQVPLKSSLIFKDHQIAYVPQSVAALDYSLSDNITLAFGENETIDENRLWYAITTAGLAELVESLPNGVRTRVGELGSRVSGGELQRIGLARALYREPRVLLLDEATSNLDYETEHKILTNLASFKDQLLIIIVSHSDHVAQFADKILEL
jgi:ABC-type bacteriocin/lantibiotic exporter with double-glycine peptidase domain